MTDDRRNEDLAKLIDDHLASSPSLQDGPDAIRAREATELLNIADLLWEAAHSAPSLEHDPVAAMLGLVPDSSQSLDAQALKRAIRAAGLKPSIIARRLSDRGWEVVTRDVFNWQTRGDASVPPALIQAIAEVTGTITDELTVNLAKSADHHLLQSVTSSPAFRALADRWAQVRGTSPSLGASALEARLAASVFRGSRPSDVQMLASLEALVTALESRSDDNS